ncbi:MAG: type II toxin-antitoxin system VapC family toxin [Steroidobacteraceae bacterium]
MIAIDTNILVYAHRRDSEWHQPAAACVRELAEGDAAWALPWPCVHEFFSIVTHERIYSPSSSAINALEQISAWIESPRVVLLSETAGYWDLLALLVEKSKITGPRIHDARIAALCIHHEVRELLSADRDFSRFAALRIRNPLLAR